MEIKWGYGRIICQWLSMMSGCVLKLVWKCVTKGWYNREIFWISWGYNVDANNSTLFQTNKHHVSTKTWNLLKYDRGVSIPHIQMVSWCFMTQWPSKSLGQINISTRPPIPTNQTKGNKGPRWTKWGCTWLLDFHTLTLTRWLRPISTGWHPWAPVIPGSTPLLDWFFHY